MKPPAPLFLVLFATGVLVFGAYLYLGSSAGPAANTNQTDQTDSSDPIQTARNELSSLLQGATPGQPAQNAGGATEQGDMGADAAREGSSRSDSSKAKTSARPRALPPIVLPDGMKRPPKDTARRKLAFDESRLLDHGVHPRDASRAAIAFDDALADITGDPAEVGPELSIKEQRLLREQLRSELEDSAFDQAMFASDQPNRVLVSEVIPGRAAERAGLQRGDVILSVGDTRVFDGREARTQMMEGTFGASTESAGWQVEVQRGDTRFYVSFSAESGSGGNVRDPGNMPGLVLVGVIGLPE